MQCPICYDEIQFDDDESAAMESRVEKQSRAVCLKECKHTFCSSCLQEHCHQSIMSFGRYEFIACPMNPLCNCYVMADEVRDVLFPEHESVYQRYVRWNQQAKDPTLAPCPTCGQLAKAPVSSDMNERFVSANGTMLALDANRRSCLVETCPQAVFCCIRGNLHVHQTCGEYMTMPSIQSSEQQIAMSNKLIDSTTKPCSHCGVRIEKSFGCDLILCTRCFKHFCYDCGTHKQLERMFKHSDDMQVCRGCNRMYNNHGQYRDAPHWNSRRAKWKRESGCVVS
ncbi:hypothetical protein MPSEU_000589100 [Mayamaea pseudoterrestris]|nr:hypothetical protein MPSEU_000589100 [Mayamaea pseudoterrestris]